METVAKLKFIADSPNQCINAPHLGVPCEYFFEMDSGERIYVPESTEYYSLPGNIRSPIPTSKGYEEYLNINEDYVLIYECISGDNIALEIKWKNLFI